MTEDLTQELVLEAPGSQETEDDLEALNPRSISQAVVSATDWTTETVLSQINKGNILLNPKFQRRDAWERQRKSKFIESLILGLPVPQLVLAESKTKKGSYIVIDGKQRLLSIRQFAAAKDDPVFEQLRLSGLDIRPDLLRKSLDDLRNEGLQGDLATFENQPIRTVVIKNWPDENFLYHVFLRLNTGSVPLSPQELRQALHPGPFVDFADEQSGKSEALRELLRLRKPDFRMRDVELLVRYYAFRNFLPRYSGDLKRFLDLTCNVLNAEWLQRERELLEQAEDFEQAYVTTARIFGPDNTFRKWTGSSYESRFNRAIFDVMVYYFSRSDIRIAAEAKAKAVEELFKQLCSTDSHFLASIERTTKSLNATYARLGIWARGLREQLGIPVEPPSMLSE